VRIAAKLVAVPDIDHRVRHRLAIQSEDTALHYQQFTFALVAFIEAHFPLEQRCPRHIERTFDSAWCS
jgi:hypothetical protein